MYADANAPSLPIFEIYTLHKCLSLASELDNSDRVMVGQQSGVEILFTELKTATGYESFADRISDLETVPFAKDVKPVKYFL